MMGMMEDCMVGAKHEWIIYHSCLASSQYQVNIKSIIILDSYLL